MQAPAPDQVTKWRGYATALRADAARADNTRLRDHLIMLALRWEAMANKEAALQRERGIERRRRGVD